MNSKVVVVVKNNPIDVVERKCDPSSQFLRQINITAYVSIRRLEWQLSISREGGLVDVVPIIQSFANICNYKHYQYLDQILKLRPDADGNYNIIEIVTILLDDFLSQQTVGIEVTTSSNEKAALLLRMIQTLGDNHSMVIVGGGGAADEGKKIMCQFPLLNKEGIHNPNLDYLFDIIAETPIFVSLTINLGVLNSNIATVDSMVIFPSSLSCSKTIDFPKRMPDKENIDIYDYLSQLEKKFTLSWVGRKAFVAELQRIASIVEIDANDFSFVVILLRMKHENMYTLCTVEFRLQCSFPSSLPLASLHDLQNSFSTPIDTSSIKTSSIGTAGAPERIARELFLLSSSVISLQAFGSNPF